MQKLVFLALVIAITQAINNIQSFNIDTDNISVSGISAGAYMATQMEVAYSSKIMGAGIVAGGPYMCALGSVTDALLNCMSMPTQINLKTIQKKVDSSSSSIDSIGNMSSHKVYIYSGTKDTVVKSGVVQKLQDQYQSYFGVTDIQTEYTIASEHAWITDNYGSACSYKGSPYMNNCSYDQAEALLTHIYGSLQAPVTQIAGNLIEVSQESYIKSGLSLNSNAYYYVPTTCQNGQQCKLHIAFHGCQMTLADIGTDFVKNTGLNEYAESNNIIVFYPQAKKSSFSPSNPNGCFDWWGYSESSLLASVDYATKSGKQMSSIWSMIEKIIGSSKSVFEVNE